MELITFIDNAAFNYFASLGFWLLIIQVPFFAVIGIFQYMKKS